MATPILIESFDSYTDGDLNGQGSWTGDTQFDIQGTKTYTGNKAVSVTPGAGIKNIRKAGTAQNSGSQAFRFLAAQTDQNAQIQLWEGTGGNQSMIVEFAADGHIYWYYGAGYTAGDLGHYSANIWHTVLFEWSNSDSKYRVTIDGGVPTAYQLGGGGYEPESADNVNLQARTGGTFYFDALTVGGTADTTVPFTDGFETYADGNLADQGGWVGGSFQVQTALRFNGAKGVSSQAIGQTDVITYKNGIEVPTGGISFWIASSSVSANTADDIYDLRSLADSTRIRVAFKTDGTPGIRVNISSGYQALKTSVAANTFYRVDVQWRSSDDYARARCDGGAWTAWEAMAGTGTIGKFYMNAYTTTGTHTAYIDTIGPLQTDAPVALLNGLNSYWKLDSDSIDIIDSNVGTDTNILYNVFERNTIGDNGAGWFNGNQWGAQTFTPAVSHTVTKARFKWRLVTDAGGTITVGIRATSGGLPTGSDLCSGTYPVTSVPGTAGWVEVDFGAGYALVAGTMYAIVCRCTASNEIDWRTDTSGVYAGGLEYESSNAGSTWSDMGGGRDTMFMELGTGVSGKILQGAAFDGATSGIAITTNGLPTGAGARSLELWVKITDLPADGKEYNFFQYGEADGGKRFEIVYHNTSGTYTLNFSAYANDCTYDVTLSLNTWYHMVATYDGTDMLLYLNGDEVGNLDSQTLNTTAGTAGYIGSPTTGYAGGAYLPGSIDEVGFWTRCLTPAEITSLYNNGAGLAYPFNPATLVSPFPMFLMF